MKNFLKGILEESFKYFLVAALSVAGTIYFDGWKGEDLRYEVSAAAYFGKEIYQNIRIVNLGRTPALNVKISFNTKKPIGEGNIKFESSEYMDIPANEAEMTIGGFKRIRKGEAVTLAFISKEEPISPEMVVIRSDQATATMLEKPIDVDYSFWFLCFLLFWMFLMIAIPAYNDYQKRKMEVIFQNLRAAQSKQADQK